MIFHLNFLPLIFIKNVYIQATRTSTRAPLVPSSYHKYDLPIPRMDLFTTGALGPVIRSSIDIILKSGVHTRLLRRDGRANPTIRSLLGSWRITSRIRTDPAELAVVGGEVAPELAGGVTHVDVGTDALRDFLACSRVGDLESGTATEVTVLI